MQSRTLKTNIIYALGSAANSAALLLLVPFLINTLSPAEYGVWALCEIGIVLMIMVVLAGMDVGLMRQYWFLKDDLERRRLTGTVLIAVSTWGLMLVGGVAIALRVLNEYLFAAQIGLRIDTVILVLAIGCAEAIFNLLLTLARIREQATWFLALSVGRMVLFLAAAIVGAQFGGIDGALLGRLLAIIPAIGVALIWLRGHISPAFVRPQFRHLLRYGLPLLPASIASYVLLASDRFILERFSTLEAVGIYAFAYKVATILDVLVNRPFALDWAPRRFKIAANSDAQDKFAEALLLYLFVAVGFSLLILAATPTIYAWVAPQRYAQGMGTVAIILAAYLVYGLSWPLNVGIMLKDQTRYLPIVSWLAALVCLALNIWLIPQYGMFGAAWATLISYAVYTCGIGWTSLQLYPIKYARSSLIYIGLGALLGYGCLWMIGTLGSAPANLWPLLARLSCVLMVMIGVGYAVWIRGRSPDAIFGYKRTSAVNPE
jgi:O-antigen/teichoic acid export membrane protein